MKSADHASRRSVGQPDVFVHRQFRPAGRRIVSARSRCRPHTTVALGDRTHATSTHVSWPRYVLSS